MPGPTRKRRLWLALALVAVTAVVFGRSVRHGFVLIDDNTNVYANPLVHPSSTDRLARTWREPHLQLYIPVTYSAWALVAEQARVDPAEPDPQAENGLSPRPFHLANLSLHCLAALLVFALLRAALGVDFAAALGAALFALHPLQAEPVAWVSGFKDLAAGVLALASLWFYALHARAAGRAPLPWVLALATFALAFLAKPSALVVPLLAWVFDVGLLRRGWKRATASLWPFALLAAVGVLVATGVQPPAPDLPELALWARPLVALDALGFYALKLSAPFELVPFYGRRPDLVLAEGRWWSGALVMAALLAAALAARRRSSVPLAALGLFTAALAPVLGLVPFTFQVFSTVADRYAYLALLGPALLLGWLARGSKPGIALALVLLGALGLRAGHQVGYWRTSKELFAHNLAVNPRSSFVHANLGEVLAREGDGAGAVEHFAEAVRLEPDSAQLRNNLGAYLGQSGRLDEALEHLSAAVRLDPDYARARMGLASTLIGLGRHAKAIEQLEQVHRIEPDFAPAHSTRGALLAAMGDLPAAALAFQDALRADPRLVDARVQLAGVYLRNNQLQEAIMALRTAVSEAPDLATAHAELGRALMISNRPLDARPHLEQALRLDPGLDYVRPLLEAARR